MNSREMAHWIVASAVNIIVVLLLVKRAWDGNDKAILLVVFYYPMLLIINLIVWLVLRSKRKDESVIYKTLALCMTILYIPVLLIAAFG